VPAQATDHTGVCESPDHRLLGHLLNGGMCARSYPMHRIWAGRYTHLSGGGPRRELRSGAVTVYLIRHATAGRRSFDSDDLERPLDEYGRLQARDLIKLLADRGITQIHSSPAVRCIQTVSPLASAIGVDVHQAGPLLEGSSLARVLEFVRSFGQSDVALCSHGDLIPEVIRALEVGGTRIGTERGFAKGAVWELRFDGDGRIDTAVYAPVEPSFPITEPANL